MIEKSGDDHYAHENGQIEITVDADDFEAVISQNMPDGASSLDDVDLEVFMKDQHREYSDWLADVLNLYDLDLWDGTAKEAYIDNGQLCIPLEFPPDDE